MKKLFYDMPHHLFDTFFECPELISNKMNWHPSTFTFFPPEIKLPFPPPITAQDIVHKRPSSKICSKSPNAFFIYRKAFFDQLALLNQRFKMTDVSKLVSLYWKNERREVKEAYKKIAQEVELELSERRKRDLVYPDINTNLKMARKGKGNNISKKKCGKVTKTTDNQSESVNFERVGSAVVNRQGGTRFELIFSSDMQPLIHEDLENYLLMTKNTLDDAVFSSSCEPIIVTETNDNDDNNFIVSEPTLDQNDVNDYAQRNNYNLFTINCDEDDDVLDPIPAQSQINQPPVENDVNSVLLNAQNVACDEFCFDENTNLNWYLQSFV